MAIINPVRLGGAQPEPTTGDYLVRFIDFDGTILKEQWVNTGQAATAPTPPIHDLLTFDEWNNDFANIQHDLDVGATYYTTDGKTYLFCRFNANTGLQPTLYLNKATTAQMDIDWGDGTSASLSVSGNFNVTKATAYATDGDYTITIFSNEEYSTSSVQNYILGNNYTTSASLIKIYLADNFSHVRTIVQGHRNLKYISLGRGNTSLPTSAFNNCFNLRCVIVPKSITTINGQICRNCTSLSYFIFYLNIPTFITTVNEFIGTALPKLHLPDCTFDLGTNFINGNRHLYNLEIPYGVASIADGSLSSLVNVKYIIFPASLISLVANCLRYNYAAEYYVFLSSNPPTMSSSSSLTDISLLCKIYVPDASVSAYQAATNWVTYASYIYPISELAEYAGTIFWQTNGADPIREWRGTPGTLAPLPIAPTKAGFTFAGWYKDEALTAEWDQNTDVCPSTNITLYAKWI